MKNTYNIAGMTCGGCKASVEKYLSAIEGVQSVTANVENAEAQILMDYHIDTSIFKRILPEKYTLSEKTETPKSKETKQNIFDTSSEESASKIQQLKPLFLIFGFIVLIATALNYNSWSTTPMMLDAMGLFFFIFSLFKLFDLKGFSTSFSMYDPLAKMLPVYGKVYPFIELALGFCLLSRIQISAVLIITIIVLGITTIGVIRSLLNKNTIKCACLGTVLDLPMTEATFIENALMILMAIIMLLNTGIL